MPQPKPLSQPMRSGRTMWGSCELLNTIDISAPMVAMTTAALIGPTRSGRPGKANHSEAQPTTSSIWKTKM